MLAIALLAYPAAVFLWLDDTGPNVLIALFAILAGVRLTVAKHLSRRATTIGVLVVFGLCSTALALESLDAVKLYPAVFSLIAALWCAHTLNTPPTAIEQLLMLTHASRDRLPLSVQRRIPLMNLDTTIQHSTQATNSLPPTEPQKRYMRGLTQAWMVFFVINATLVSITAMNMSTGIWALYSGLLSYLLIALLVLAEVLYRPIYQRRYGDMEERPVA